MAMSAYADTGFIISLMTPDANSRAATGRMGKQDLPLLWTWLHELEFRNALRLRVFRKELTRAEVDRTIAQLLADLAAGIYRRREPDPSQFVLEAERLSAGRSAKLGTRSLDVLHVACALEFGASEFLTFDKRQAALAEAAGMSMPSL